MAPSFVTVEFLGDASEREEDATDNRGLEQVYACAIDHPKNNINKIFQLYMFLRTIFARSFVQVSRTHDPLIYSVWFQFTYSRWSEAHIWATYLA